MFRGKNNKKTTAEPRQIYRNQSIEFNAPVKQKRGLCMFESCFGR